MIVRTSKLRHTKGTEIGAKVEVRLTSWGNFIDDPNSYDPNSYLTPILIVLILWFKAESN